ncbi:hypothetical protein [Saccharopolyspora gregorii]|uniref:hypothetical protein n=1 Tax=Saccharopolyspora gregorii TaxID=33914 RepID=UPI0021AC4B89|nr:hypothetical protein [Saccharopolyspora gregorii]
MSDKQGIDYWRDSDAWKDTDYADWNKIDAFVEEGYMTEDERDLIQARGSAAALGQISSPGETDDSWEKYLDLKEEYKDDPRFGENGNAEDLPKPDGEGEGPNEDTDYVDQLDWGLGDDETPPGVEDPPKVPKYDNEGKEGDEVVVSTEALKTFAQNMLKLKAMITPAKDYVSDVEILPGAFANAYRLRDRVMGSSGENGSAGLKTAIYDFLHNTERGFDFLEEDLARVLKEYAEAEDLNKVAGSDFDAIMAKAYSYIGETESGK